MKSPRRLPLLALAALAGTLASGCETPHYHSQWDRRPTPVTPPAEGRAVPAGSFDGASATLLNEYAGRDPVTREEAASWQLPFHAKRVVVALLIMAARDDFSMLDAVVTPTARWGIPDRREYDAVPISGADGGAGFADALRSVASRFADKASFNCPPIANPLQNYVRDGAEPMWCFYLSSDQIDVLAFKLVVDRGAARIDYVGMLTERPNGPVAVRPGRDSPPMVPSIKRRSGPTPPLLRPAPEGLPLGAPPAGAPLGAPPASAPLGAPPAGAPPVEATPPG